MRNYLAMVHQSLLMSLNLLILKRDLRREVSVVSQSWPPTFGVVVFPELYGPYNNVFHFSPSLGIDEGEQTKNSTIEISQKVEEGKCALSSA